MGYLNHLKYFPRAVPVRRLVPMTTLNRLAILNEVLLVGKSQSHGLKIRHVWYFVHSVSYFV